VFDPLTAMRADLDFGMEQSYGKKKEKKQNFFHGTTPHTGIYYNIEL
jgi:hypothetical protein